MNDPSNKTELKARLLAVQERMRAAAERAGRNANDLTLIVVTKTHPAETIRNLIEIGVDQFGENRVQEMTSKMDAVGSAGHWHLIGHLQRNKAAPVVGRAELIHSVDSIRLIEELEKRTAQAGVVQRVLLEINVGDDPNKTGARASDLTSLLEALARAPHLRAEGLMTIPPYSDDAEASRPHFRKLRTLLESVSSSPHFTPKHLSMGMSGDYEVAIEEGATMVRVGTAILGDRLGA